MMKPYTYRNARFFRSLLIAVMMIGTALTVCRPASAAQTTLNVSIAAGSFPSPLNAGQPGTATLSASASNAPTPTSENKIKGPTWGWSIVQTQYETPSMTSWANATQYYSDSISQPDTTKPDATLNATFLRACSWKITVKVTLDYSDTNGNTWHGEATQDVNASPSLNATLAARRTGSGATFGNSVNIAAGGQSTNVHKADLKISISPAVGGVYVDPPTISGTSGISVQGAVAMSGNTTASDGTITGTYTSGDLVGGVSLSGPGSVNISQHWDDASGGSDWKYNAYYDVNQPSPVSFLPTISDGGSNVAITAHTIGFVVTQVDLSVYNSSTGNYDQMSYTTDPNAANSSATPPVYYKSDLSGYASFSPGSAGDSGNGVYTSSLTVTDATVDTVYFNATDSVVYLN